MFAQADLKSKLKNESIQIQKERNCSSRVQFDTVFWQISIKQ